MNLLKTDTYELVCPRPVPHYAILSHRWEPEEISYHLIKRLKPSAFQNPALPTIPANLRASAVKIRNACALARQQGIGYIWIDVCCFDKRATVEISRTINSVFKWYREADVCYTYLRDVTFSTPTEKMFLSDRPDRYGHASEWFERGWTLQDLLAPRQMQFYDKHWKPMGTRNQHAMLIAKITGIEPAYVTGKRPLSDASCALKMNWMAGRLTQNVEDIAYSLLGIFDVNMSPEYGDGPRAFLKLQEAIISTYGHFDESLLAWERPSDNLLRCYRTQPSHIRDFEFSKWGLLAPSPDCFKRTGDICVRKDLLVMRPGLAFSRSSMGICLTLPSSEVKHRFGGSRNEINVPLNCWRNVGNQALETVVLRVSKGADGVMYRTQLQELHSQRGAKVSHRGSVVIAVGQPQLARY